MQPTVKTSAKELSPIAPPRPQLPAQAAKAATTAPAEVAPAVPTNGVALLRAQLEGSRAAVAEQVAANSAAEGQRAELLQHWRAAELPVLTPRPRPRDLGEPSRPTHVLRCPNRAERQAAWNALDGEGAAAVYAEAYRMAVVATYRVILAVAVSSSLFLGGCMNSSGGAWRPEWCRTAAAVG